MESVWQVQRGLWLQRRPRPMEALEGGGHLCGGNRPVRAAIERQLSGLTAILNLFQFVMMALAISGAVIMLYTGYLYVINPLANLRDGLKQLESGDFSARVDVDTPDEFGQVAAGSTAWPARCNRCTAAGNPGGKKQAPHQAQRTGGAVRVSAFLAEANTIEELSGVSQRCAR